jgi:hypothetical protein
MIGATALALLGASNVALAQPRHDGPRWEPPYQRYEPRYRAPRAQAPRYRAPRYTQASPVSRVRMATAAHVLSDRAERLHRLIEGRNYFSHLAASVHRFSDMAEQQNVEHNAGHGQLMNDFRALERDYFRLRMGLEHAHDVHHSPVVQASWDTVAGAYGTLAATFGGGYVAHDGPYVGFELSW